MTRRLALAVKLPRATCCAGPDCTPLTCMVLPAGESCGTCLWIGRCMALGVTTPDGLACDFFPRRFIRDAELAS